MCRGTDQLEARSGEACDKCVDFTIIHTLDESGNEVVTEEEITDKA